MSENYKFKVGDRVQFKYWREMEEEFGVDEVGEIPAPTCFTRPMRHLCGTYATIAKIYNDGYSCELKDFSTQEKDDVYWDYSLDMLKHFEDVAEEPREGIKVLENLDKYFLENFLDTDVVTVRSIIDVINEYKQNLKTEVI